MRTCNVEDCSSIHTAKGMCNKHYMRFMRTGRTYLKPIPEQLKEHIELDPETGCWIWIGYLDKWGYGRTTVRGKKMLVHRAMWEAVNGPIPDGLLVCHKCDVPPCSNPEHLFIGTQKDNIQDSINKKRFTGYKEKSACPDCGGEMVDDIYYMRGTNLVGMELPKECKSCGYSTGEVEGGV